MSIESPRDLEALRRVGRVVAETIAEARRRVRPGMTTAELRRRRRSGARPPRRPVGAA